MFVALKPQQLLLSSWKVKKATLSFTNRKTARPTGSRALAPFCCSPLSEMCTVQRPALDQAAPTPDWAQSGHEGAALGRESVPPAAAPRPPGLRALLRRSDAPEGGRREGDRVSPRLRLPRRGSSASPRAPCARLGSGGQRRSLGRASPGGPQRPPLRFARRPAPTPAPELSLPRAAG